MQADVVELMQNLIFCSVCAADTTCFNVQAQQWSAMLGTTTIRKWEKYRVQLLAGLLHDSMCMTFICEEHAILCLKHTVPSADMSDTSLSRLLLLVGMQSVSLPAQLLGSWQSFLDWSASWEGRKHGSSRTELTIWSALPAHYFVKDLFAKMAC